MSWDNLDQAISRLQAKAPAHWGSYVGFYSSWLDGFFKEPWAMTLPLDDHGFHRGDGVFEAVRIFQRAYIDLQPHLLRLQKSAESIGMQLPKTVPQLTEICLRLARECNLEHGMLRLYVTRGPGDFGPNPKTVVEHQVYAAMTHFKPISEALYTNGCRTLISSFEAKTAFYSRIKSCNYLQNVLMKQECVEKGFDMALALDALGRVTEGSTENFICVSAEGSLLVPRFDYTLRGTTLLRVLEIAEQLKTQGLLRSIELADFPVKVVYEAREAAFVGTTLGVLPVTSVGDRPIGTGRVGEVMRELNSRLVQRLAHDESVRTPF